MTIETEYGLAHVIAKTDKGYCVCILKKDMKVTHPNYRGGPCVNFILEQKGNCDALRS